MKHSFSHVLITTQHAWLYYILPLKTRIRVKKDKKRKKSVKWGLFSHFPSFHPFFTWSTKLFQRSIGGSSVVK